MPKKSYQDLLHLVNKLERKLETLIKQNEIANRHTVFWDVSDWVSIPIHPKQEESVREAISALIGTGKEIKVTSLSGDNLEIIRTNILPEFDYLLVRKTYGLEIKIWGLVPV